MTKDGSFECIECLRSFSIGVPPEAEKAQMPEDPSGGVSPAGPKAPSEEDPQIRDVAKDLAQVYFSGIEEKAAPAQPAPAGKQPGRAANGGREWTPEMNGYSEEELRQQREKLFQYAANSEENKEKDDLPPQTAASSHVKHFVRESKRQVIMFWLLLPVLCLIPFIRILLGRLTASVEQFSWMQAQIIPSFLYFIAAVILAYRLLRRTVAPRVAAAWLLAVPLILDCWYLVPGLSQALAAGIGLNISNTAKLVFSLFGLFQSLKAAKRPALRYKEDKPIYG